MRNFILFLILVFAGLFTAIVYKPHPIDKPTLRVYGSSSFISQWGPGPWLKEKFESTCQCKVDYFDSADSTLLMQRLKSEARSYGADVVLGFDQYDLELAQQGLDWKKLKVDPNLFIDSIKSLLGRTEFIPYNWGVLSFVVYKSELEQLPKTLDDLLSEEFKDQIAIQDPRTSSPGLQFILWAIQAKGEEEAFQYFKKFIPQTKAVTHSWSMANGLFQKEQVKAYFSYTTSPVYFLTQDKNSDVVAIEFSEGHPVQYEYVGIPTACRNCELAEKYVSLILSEEGQKVIMERNYMFPVRKGVKDNTPFALVPNYPIIESPVLPSLVERERILKKWSQLRPVE